jgi:hypothetical protein
MSERLFEDSDSSDRKPQPYGEGPEGFGSADSGKRLLKTHDQVIKIGDDIFQNIVPKDDEFG